MADRNPVGLADLIGYQLRLTDLLALRDARTTLASFRITPAKVTALAFVRDNPGCDQSSLARFLDVNRASAMKLVNVLEEQGLVERREGRDRRSNGLHLTVSGEDSLSAMTGALLDTDARLASLLTARERRELLRLLAKVREALETAQAATRTEAPEPKRLAG
jgi:DNA-binding MarR family transcriptional regulator